MENFPSCDLARTRARKAGGDAEFGKSTGDGRGLERSIVLWIVLVLINVGPSSALAAQQKARIRRLLKEQYFGADNVENGLQPYEVLLREANEPIRAATTKPSAEIIGRSLICSMLKGFLN